ncbi:MAG TPA: amidohydrolase family protein [Acidobacteriaceae bacterium]|nr:amidohydrolase family protein [Acidobacteriaceae bacterium]
MKALASGVFLALAMSNPSAPAQSPADAIYFHGNILTGVDLDAAHPQRVTAIAVAHGEILAAGTDQEILTRYKGAATHVVDLHGEFVMPGFNDAHTHLGMGGHILLSVDLLGVHSLSEMQARIRAAAEKAAPGQWLSGGGWDHTLWPGAALPTRQDIDAAAMGHPAIFTRVDGHIAVADSTALAASGITRATPNPHGGALDHDANGEPTGIIRETAQSLVQIPPPTPEQRRRGLELAMQDAVSHGLTSVQDFSDWDDYLVFEQLEKEGKLPVRIGEWIPFAEPLDVELRQQAQHPKTDRMLHTTMLKGFMDGSLGSRTAAMNAPYADDPGNSGIPRFEQDKLNAMAIERARAGFQMGFHAIGDRAVGMALDAFAAAEQAVPGSDRRDRIEHSQVLSAGDFARYKQLGVIASMQPNHLLSDMAWAETRLGPERSKYAYAWKSFLDAGVPLAYGTDYPVEPLTPFRGVYCSVTRMNETGNMTFHPEQKLTMAQTLTAYTQGSAYAEFAERWKGKLAPGYVADFVVLDRDLTTAGPHDILGTKVLRTVVGGKTVFESSR